MAEAEDWEQELLRLAAAGVLKLPKRRLAARAGVSGHARVKHFFGPGYGGGSGGS